MPPPTMKTDKIHRILNTPYDELSPQDFAVAQEQLDVLVVGTRDKQIDAFQFIENKLVCERDAAIAERDQLAQTATANAETLRMTEREHAVTVENLETALAGTKAERDQLKGICERLKRELEEANGALYDSMQVESKRAARIADLERVAKTDAEAIANLTKERDQLDDELTDLRQAPSRTAKQAERIRELEERCTDLGQQTCRAAGALSRAYKERDDLKAELEQAKAQAANASAMVVSIAAERDTTRGRELNNPEIIGYETTLFGELRLIIADDDDKSIVVSVKRADLKQLVHAAIDAMNHEESRR